MQKADANVVSSIYNESQSIAESSYNYQNETCIYNGQSAMNVIDQTNTDIDFNWLKCHDHYLCVCSRTCFVSYSAQNKAQ